MKSPSHLYTVRYKLGSIPVVEDTAIISLFTRTSSSSKQMDWYSEIPDETTPLLKDQFRWNLSHHNFHVNGPKDHPSFKTTFGWFIELVLKEGLHCINNNKLVGIQKRTLAYNNDSLYLLLFFIKCLWVNKAHLNLSFDHSKGKNRYGINYIQCP